MLIAVTLLLVTVWPLRLLLPVTAGYGPDTPVPLISGLVDSAAPWAVFQDRWVGCHQRRRPLASPCPGNVKRLRHTEDSLSQSTVAPGAPGASLPAGREGTASTVHGKWRAKYAKPVVKFKICTCSGSTQAPALGFNAHCSGPPTRHSVALEAPVASDSRIPSMATVLLPILTNTFSGLMSVGIGRLNPAFGSSRSTSSAYQLP
ncbi:collagen alpha-1(I) chain-like protein [Lates japonicus]|uniref:Collagen alpha-1(I) chain-like protein n=1 Tax=Lates japonicus TaxID=270547 RepID=A0AAD3MRN8_LATJO|nr:collagen alpha-1(I) chain-like protein [Lates japonicus]